MGVIYQLTFFLAIALLAILITIFVFAVSLLGRAIEAAARTAARKILESKENTKQQMARIRQEIEKGEKSGEIPKGLTKELRELEEKDKKLDKELKQIRKTPEPLTVRGGVIYSGSFLIAALVFNGAAWYLSNLENVPATAPLALWLLGLAAMGYCVYRIYKSLNVIQSVAVTSEEESLRKTIDAFKIAQKEIEEEKKPELHLRFPDKEFPLHVDASMEIGLEMMMVLRRGEFAEDVEIHIGAPQGFSFPKEDTYTFSEDHDYPNYVCMVWHRAKVMKGLTYNKKIIIKTPPTARNYKMVYYTFCKGFASPEPTKLEIIVE